MHHRIRHLCAALAAAVFAQGAAAAAAAPFLDDVGIVDLADGDRQDLKQRVLDFLKKADDGARANWASAGPDGLEADFSVDNSSATGRGAKTIFCRQLSLLLRAGGKEQDLSRKTCTQQSGKFDIDAVDPVAVVYPRFLSDLTVARLNKKEAAELTAVAVNALQMAEDDTSVEWRNKGLGNAQALTVTLSVSATATKPGGFRICRDLSMLVQGKSAAQTLKRRSCEGRSGHLDIEPGHERDE
ncbi:hypothetical protein [Janthinobacterium sp.]|uniref:hypothetical protein n=1 Tax=Janthinobacterium sp. TaxID=1871054 RepID=UPI00293D398C|nr:hypothetical protein [Janthinobacterium sp.]